MNKDNNNDKKLFRQNRKAREALLKTYFPFLDDDVDAENIINSFSNEIKNISAIKDKNECLIYAQQIVNVLFNKESMAEITALIKNNLKNWEYERIPKINIAILHISIIEIIYLKKFSPSIIINEAVILSKKFLGDESYKFINGILGKVSKRWELSNVLSVSMLNLNIANYLLREPSFKDLSIKGELSLRGPFREGQHSYFILKDDNSEISCIIWKNIIPFSELKNLKNGDEVIVKAKLNFWDKKANVSLVIYEISKVDIGDINKNLELLKQKLYNEGLFDTKNKKPLPTFPLNIGLITKRDSAAYNDVIDKITERNNLVNVYFFNSVMQGETSTNSIIKNLDLISSEYGFLDLVILVRGGGSIEDLYSFNDEKLIRRIFDFEIPLISGVGHEIDTCLVDYVSDVRAITPTEAAEKSVPRIEDYMYDIEEYKAQIVYNLNSLIQNLSDELDHYKKEDLILKLKGKLNDCLLTLKTFNVEALKEELSSSLNNYSFSVDSIFESLKNKMNDIIKELENKTLVHYSAVKHKSPKSIFKLGYSYILGNDGKVKTAKTLKKKDKVKAVFYDGEKDLEVL